MEATNTISREPRLLGYNVKTVKVKVSAPDSTGKTTAMKAGQLVFLNSAGDGYEALLAAGTTAVGVLAEDVTPTKAGVEVRVVYDGDVYIEGVRAAGDATSYISDLKLILNSSKINFILEEKA